MCGIAGSVGWRDPAAAMQAIERNKHALRHRGPDGEGTWVAPNAPVAFGHRRLSIIDLRAEADQPMRSHDGRLVIVFNGEIYNYRELRAECQTLGSQFATASDTEVILEAYRHWGPDAVTRFQGMWAFALFDQERREVLLSRDPFGIKPLYYGLLDGVFHFSSEPKGLRAVDDRFAEIDDVTVRMFEEHRHLERGDWTFFRRIKRFPHGHNAVLNPERADAHLVFHRHWTPPSSLRRIGFGEAAAEVGRLLERSVELHLRSDVPVGSCLSGGLDSSAIVCLGAKKLPAGQPFHTFTTEYPDHPEIDETHWARRVIGAVGAHATFVHPTYEQFVADFGQMIDVQDEPIGSTSIYAQFSIFRAIAASGVKVVLDGQGADEQLGGYQSLLPHYLNDRVARNFSRDYLREWSILRWRDHKKIRGQWLQWLKGLAAPVKAEVRLHPSGDARWSSVADELQARLASLELPADSFEQTLVNLTLETNLQELLRYEDRNSMAFSVESRVPFLEPQLVSFVLALPAEYKLQRGLTKAVLREVLRGRIPEEVRARRSKLGFPTPELEWLARGFGVSAETAGSAAWRKLVTQTWKKNLYAQRA